MGIAWERTEQKLGDLIYLYSLSLSLYIYIHYVLHLRGDLLILLGITTVVLLHQFGWPGPWLLELHPQGGEGSGGDTSDSIDVSTHALWVDRYIISYKWNKMTQNKMKQYILYNILIDGLRTSSLFARFISQFLAEIGMACLHRAAIGSRFKELVSGFALFLIVSFLLDNVTPNSAV